MVSASARRVLQSGESDYWSDYDACPDLHGQGEPAQRDHPCGRAQSTVRDSEEGRDAPVRPVLVGDPPPQRDARQQTVPSRAPAALQKAKSGEHPADLSLSSETFPLFPNHSLLPQIGVSISKGEKCTLSR